MIFRYPNLETSDFAVLKLIEGQRARLHLFTQGAPRRWLGSLRRLSFAKNIQASNSIEGIDATMDEAVAAVENEPPLDPRDADAMAVLRYREAMTYIMQAARDPGLEVSKQFIKGIHFMMTSYEMKANPGLFRPGSIRVISDSDDAVVYEAPEWELIDGLCDELVAFLQVGPSALEGVNEAHSALSVVRGALAHLNLVMIHPFSDGNGRMSRALQTFVLAREGGSVDPIFASIEEWLGEHTESYYKILADVGQGKWSPQNDALPWVRFCLRAHYQQAARIIQRNDEYRQLFEVVAKVVEARRLPKRCEIPLFDTALGLSIANQRYASLAEVEPHTASRDLKLLVDAELFVPVGERRGRVYQRSKLLAELRASTRINGKIVDPYDLV
ncbi:MAG: Fic family protein [Hyphomicrobium sp.]